MNKILKIIILLLSMSMQKTHTGNMAYPFIQGYLNMIYHVNTFISPALTALNHVGYHKALPQTVDAPDIIVDFCHKKFKEHELDPKSIHIKVRKECGFLEAFGKNHIVMSPDCANQLKDALENSTDPVSINIVKLYSFFLDHEIAHLKNNDTSKRLALLMAASLSSYAVTTYIIKKSPMSSLFREITSIKDSLIAWGAYSTVNLAHSISTKSLYAQYSRYQESRADNYAITCATDPEVLRAAARFLESFDLKILDFLCGNEDVVALVPPANLIPMKIIRTYLTNLYKKEKPQEEFREWTKGHVQILAFLQYLWDLEHPSGFSRGATMRKAADLLTAA